MPHDRPPEPWDSFLAAIDETAETAITLHCIGGFALAMLYGLPRPTGDVDFLAVIPAEAGAPLRSLAGEGSVLHRKYRVYVQYVGIVAVPEDYEERLRVMFPSRYRRLRLLGLEAHDLALSKLEATPPATGRM